MNNNLSQDDIYRIRIDFDRDLPTIDFRELLNEEQYKVVTSDMGPAICIAGAGSGKTRVITYRVAYLLTEQRVRERIVLLTFTNKAAKEMLSRVGAIFSPSRHIVSGGTFHHIALSYLRRFSDRLGFKPNFTIMDDEDAEELMGLSLEELSIKKETFVQPVVLLDIYGLSINTLKCIEDVLRDGRPYLLKYTEEINRVLIRYNQKKEELNLMDFDDILKHFFILLTHNRDVGKAISDEISCVLVDEFQDTTPIQAEIAYSLAAKNGNIMVVGDDAQSIYSFRGASINNMLSFPERFKGCEIFSLNTNYRSTRNILSIAQDIISYNERQFIKELRPVREEGERPWLIAAYDTNEEARFVTSRIAEIINEGNSPSEIAVLYRAHSHSMDLQMELVRAGIPFIIRSGLRFFEQAHIKDIISFLRVLYNANDEISAKRLFRMFPGIGNRLAQLLLESVSASKMNILDWINGYRPDLRGRARGGFDELKRILLLARDLMDRRPSELLDMFKREFYTDLLKARYPDAIERLMDIDFFIEFLSRFDTLTDLMGELSLMGNLEVERSQSGSHKIEGSIVLSTVHQAKGLEFDTVFIIGLSEGMFPSQFSLGYKRDLEEERRLFYVAITRAKNNLYLSYPRLYLKTDRSVSVRRPSRFIGDIKNLSEKVRLIKVDCEER